MLMRAMGGKARAVACLVMIGGAACGSRTGLFDNPVPGAGGDPMLCGNGVVDPSEACDDGNATTTDSCTASCN